VYHDPFVNLRWSFGRVQVQAVLGGESSVTGDVRGTVSVLLDSRFHDTGSLTILIKLQESGADLEKPNGSELRNDSADGTVVGGATEQLAPVLGDGSSCSEPMNTALEC